MEKKPSWRYFRLTITIDGSYGEGGGQILRVALALSAVTGEPINIYNIRVGRKPPGLRPQHRTAVEAVALLTNATVEGLNLGSLELKFMPRQSRGGKFIFDTGTAGSTTLVLQSLLPVMIFSKVNTEVELRGGTNNPLAPTYDYIERVVIPIVSLMGVKISVKLLRRGFYPKGGGILVAKSESVNNLCSIRLDSFQGIKNVEGIAYSSRLPSHITSRMVKAAQAIVQDSLQLPVNIVTEVTQASQPKCAPSPGCGMLLTAMLNPCGILGADALGEVGKPAEKVGEEAANALLETIRRKAPVDKHLGDQLIIYMSLAGGKSIIRVSELTLHTIGCTYVCESFLGKRFTITGKVGQPATITCTGIGFTQRKG
jgi:RNA 3'-terminal phosphate cyclase (ATP)